MPETTAGHSTKTIGRTSMSRSKYKTCVRLTQHRPRKIKIRNSKYTELSLYSTPGRHTDIHFFFTGMYSTLALSNLLRTRPVRTLKKHRRHWKNEIRWTYLVIAALSFGSGGSCRRTAHTLQNTQRCGGR